MLNNITKGITGFNGPRGEEGAAGDQGSTFQGNSAYVPMESLGELSGAETLAKFAKDGHLDVGNVVKSYIEMEKFRGNSIRIPGEGASIDEVNEYRAKLGIPGKAEEYDFDTKGMDEEVATEFKKVLHENGCPKTLANKIVGFYAEQYVGGLKAKADKMVEEGTAKLQKEWGKDYENNLKEAVKARDIAAGDDDLAKDFKKLMNDVPQLGNHPVMARIFHNVSKIMAEGKFAGDRQILTADNIDQRIKELEADPATYNRNHPNWKHNNDERTALYKKKYPD